MVAGCGPGSTGASFQNPVYRHDFPDPFVLRVGRIYYAYATDASGYNIPVMTSRDLVHWRGPKEAMPRWAPWTDGLTWAPSVLRRADGRYVMYYAGHDKVSSRQCIGTAISGSPTGPFVDHEKSAFLCALSLGGAIDPAIFRDRGGRLYLIWKNDGNCCRIPTHMFVQRLSIDGLRLESAPVSLAVDDQSWEGDVIEGPTMWMRGGRYYLFYSGGKWDSDRYAVGYSICRAPMGPCEDGPHNPILSSRCNAAGPGGETITVDASGQTWLVYDAWPRDAVGADTPGRVLWIDRLDWPHRRPVVRGPTCARQPAPAS
jgi:beta-xylosidase